MLVGALTLGWRVAITFLAGVAGGVSNGVAGGGTFFTFPTLLALGIPALTANVTTTVGIWPSFIGGLTLVRSKGGLIEGTRSLIPVVMAGSLIGTALLLTGSPHTFERIVPYLITVATGLFAAAPWITRRLSSLDHSHPARRVGLVIGVGAISIYGGYFGAGVGIMLLAVTALTLPVEIHRLQGLRAVLSIVMTTVAGVVFVLHGPLALEELWPLLVGTFVGGWLGTILITRLPASAVRVLVITIGLVTAVKLFVAP